MHSLGNLFQISLFGESHASMIGVTMNGIAPGIKLDKNKIKEDLKKRRPSLKSETSRQEADDFDIVSGYYNGYTTGAPLTILIKNSDVKSKNYDQLKHTYRPSHADYTADMHYLGYHDKRGGGIFSGRLTAALVVAGSIATTILESMNIKIETHISQVMDREDDKFDNVEEQIKAMNENKLPIINSEFEDYVLKTISEVKDDQDSLGAHLETVILNVEPGIGEPFFNKLDATLAHYIMSIPAIKGVSFGTGFDFKNHLGSDVADEYYYEENTIRTYSNHNGGIVGGISTGMPIIINSVVKPTPTIYQELRSVDTEHKENNTIKIAGRHDSSIFTRIPIVVNSMVACALVDLYSMRYGIMIQRGKDSCLDS